MDENLLTYFLEQNVLSPDQIVVLKEEQKKDNRSIKSIIQELEFLGKDRLLELVADYFETPFVCLKSHPVEFNEHNIYLKNLGAFAFLEDKYLIHIVVEDPLDILLKDKIRAYFQKKNILKPIEWYVGNLDILLKEEQQDIFKENILHSIDFLDDLLTKAIFLKATDIHIKPKEKIVDIFFRINGVMVLQKTLHKGEFSVLVNKIKVLSKLDIAQSRIAQSGSFQKYIYDRLIYFRASTHPTLEGESLAIRILDLKKNILGLDSLGIETEHLLHLKNILDEQAGLILLTGATGSGKTTTLYACLDYLKEKSLNIMTLEDPVECELYFATQTEVSPIFTYEMGIKSILRQDPDVILVGEIRDEITAKMVFRAAMTGHLVLSTLHTYSLDTLVERLEDFKISAHLINSFLKFGMQQSLEKKMHDRCFGKGCVICFGSGVESRYLKTDIKKFE